MDQLFSLFLSFPLFSSFFSSFLLFSPYSLSFLLFSPYSLSFSQFPPLSISMGLMLTMQPTSSAFHSILTWKFTLSTDYRRYALFFLAIALYCKSLLLCAAPRGPPEPPAPAHTEACGDNCIGCLCTDLQLPLGPGLLSPLHSGEPLIKSGHKIRYADILAPCRTCPSDDLLMN